MSRRIIVAGNCQIAGLSAALKRIFGADEISALPFNPNTFKGDDEAFASEIASADVVLGSKAVGALLQRIGRQPRNFVAVPGIYFSAFHPDLVATRGPKGGRAIPYNSAICAWAYNRKLEPRDTVRLYNRDTFARLGYFNRWDTSVAVLKSAFEAAGLDFDRFYLAAKRDGAFMHTVNHPKAPVLAWLAKLLSLKMGQDASVWRKEIVFSDALARIEIWPVYPEVANELALPGSWTWLVERGRVIDGLPEYVEYAYARYAKAGIAPGDLQVLGVDRPSYDEVLSSALERS